MLACNHIKSFKRRVKNGDLVKISYGVDQLSHPSNTEAAIYEWRRYSSIRLGFVSEKNEYFFRFTAYDTYSDKPLVDVYIYWWEIGTQNIIYTDNLKDKSMLRRTFEFSSADGSHAVSLNDRVALRVGVSEFSGKVVGLSDKYLILRSDGNLILFRNTENGLELYGGTLPMIYYDNKRDHLQEYVLLVKNIGGVAPRLICGILTKLNKNTVEIVGLDMNTYLIDGHRISVIYIL